MLTLDATDTKQVPLGGNFRQLCDVKDPMGLPQDDLW